MFSVQVDEGLPSGVELWLSGRHLNRHLLCVPLFHYVTTNGFAYLGWQFYGCVMIWVIFPQSGLQVFFSNVGIAFGNRD